MTGDPRPSLPRVATAASPDVPTAPLSASSESPSLIDASFESPSPTDPTRTTEPTRSPQSLLTATAPAIQLRDPKRYHLLGEHGRGGLGRVSRAHDVELGRDVAIKE